MKGNQSGENQKSIENHLEEHYNLLRFWDVMEIDEERKQALRDIIEGRQIALQKLKDEKITGMVTTQTVLRI